MTIVNATENPPLATAIRGYDVAAVDAALARETAQLRSHAEHSVSAAMATLEEQCLQAERSAEDTAQGMVASAAAWMKQPVTP